MISRRSLLMRGAGAAAFALTSRKSGLAQSKVSRVTVQNSQRIGRIRPELHGHFAEHLGSCTYGGLWVGRQSTIPNIGGFRKAAVEYLKALGIPVLRWPGGCFADDYHWRDGIGAARQAAEAESTSAGASTPRTTASARTSSSDSAGRSAPSRISRATSARGTPRRMRDWVEYCNFPGGSTLSDERGANGRDRAVRHAVLGRRQRELGLRRQHAARGVCCELQALFHVRAAARRHRRRAAVSDRLRAERNDPAWTRGFFETMGSEAEMLDGYAMHFYSNGESPATKFRCGESARTARQLRRNGDEPRAAAQLSARLRYSERIGLLVDEWGVWDRMVPEEEKRYGQAVPADHDSQRGGGGARTERVPSPGGQADDVQHRADGERAALDHADGWDKMHPHSHLLGVRAAETASRQDVARHRAGRRGRLPACLCRPRVMPGEWRSHS